tara:strand:- start:38 stop:370 length:333 start_codon:yes stop_codon:yes gene_type:complete
MKKVILWRNPVIKLSEQISFGVHASNWDESHVFKDFQDFERIYFIGDKWKPMGIDYERFVFAGKFSIKTTKSKTTLRIFFEIHQGPISINQISPKLETPPQRDWYNFRSS